MIQSYLRLLKAVLSGNNVLWSMVVDEMQDSLCANGFKILGYVDDDIAIKIGGEFEVTVSDRVQCALNIITQGKVV